MSLCSISEVKCSVTVGPIHVAVCYNWYQRRLSRGLVMVETQNESTPNEGISRLEHQMQTFMEDSQKRMEMIEANQQRMNAENLKKQDDNSRRLDVLLSHMESEKRLDAVTWGRSRVALVYGNSPMERGDSSVRPVSSPVTPISFMANRGMTLPPALFNTIPHFPLPMTQHPQASLYPAAPTSLANIARTSSFPSIPPSVTNPNFATQNVNPSINQTQVGLLYLPPLADQAIANSSFLQPNIPRNIQPINQNNTQTPTNSSYEALKLKYLFQSLMVITPVVG
ncbi:hypothetical protein FXO37_19278 [Capsicum annuum]|nr:hypothetical protein FXO37_19278 [Capsicum annuum]